jgi:hypothetical protein
MSDAAAASNILASSVASVLRTAAALGLKIQPASSHS